MNERELFTSDATVVQVDEQDPQQMQVRHSMTVNRFDIHSHASRAAKQGDQSKHDHEHEQ